MRGRGACGDFFTQIFGQGLIGSMCCGEIDGTFFCWTDRTGKVEEGGVVFRGVGQGWTVTVGCGTRNLQQGPILAKGEG